MSEQLSWYLARAGGLVAWSALVMSVVLGLMLAGRLVPRGKAGWIQEVHQYLGGLATVFTAIHVLALVADNYVYFGWREIFVPFGSEWEPVAVAGGVIGFYLLIAIETTSLAMQRLPRWLWKAIHQLSLPLFVLSTLHGFLAGSDSSGSMYMTVTLGACAVVAVLAVARRVYRPRPRRVVVG